MIPRLKPYFSIKELIALFQLSRDNVSKFEQKFAAEFEAQYALSFRHGRSGLYALLKSQGIEGREIIMPAYTCVVVAHAVVLSGNIPKFVDISLKDYNMDLELVEKAVNEKTGAIIATNLFGYPLNAERLGEIVKNSGRKILVIQDCAHSFGSKFRDKYSCNYGDAAIFGLNISKQVSSVFGGMVTTNDAEVYSKLEKYRGENSIKPGILKKLKLFLYFISTYFTFNRFIYGLVNYIEENTGIIDRFTKYFDEATIDFPDDYKVALTGMEAKIGAAQLEKYPEIANILKPLTDTVTTKEMQGMNAAVAIDHKADREVALDYLKKKGLIQ